MKVFVNGERNKVREGLQCKHAVVNIAAKMWISRQLVYNSGQLY